VRKHFECRKTRCYNRLDRAFLCIMRDFLPRRRRRESSVGKLEDRPSADRRRTGLLFVIATFMRIIE